MGIEDGRGKYMKEVHRKNRKAIVEWELNNTGSMRDCSRDTGISYATVRSHFAEMATEWNGEHKEDIKASWSED